MLSICIFLIGGVRPLCSAYASFTPAEKFNTPAELIAQCCSLGVGIAVWRVTSFARGIAAFI